MNLWKIKILYYGKITAPKAAVTANMDPDLILDWPYLGFLLQDGRQNVLVDTGISDNFIVDGKAWGGFPAEGGKRFLLKALTEAGLSPPNIGTVIYTHLHNDHAANSSLFTNARLIFQKEEWATLLDPLPVMNVRKDYDSAIVEELKSMNCLQVDGDAEIAGGIRLYKIPGHTPGSQAVAVNTSKGIRILVGDHWHLHCMGFGYQQELVDMEGRKHKITPAPETLGRFIPSTLIYNYYDYYDSCNKILSLIPEDKPEYIVPGHETSLIFPVSQQEEEG